MDTAEKSFPEVIGYQFKDSKLMELALTHPSIIADTFSTQSHNQRLEFLGDAVLQVVISRELYVRYPLVDEGLLTKARAKLVNRRTLSELSRHLHIGRFLVMSRGEEFNGGRERASCLADAFEAVIGAIFLDGGYEAAQQFILHQFEDALKNLDTAPHIDNPKGELQEVLQARSRMAPVYLLIGSSGPDHDRVFECLVEHEGVPLGRGTGKSKKDAETQAAMSALALVRDRKV